MKNIEFIFIKYRDFKLINTKIIKMDRTKLLISLTGFLLILFGVLGYFGVHRTALSYGDQIFTSSVDESNYQKKCIRTGCSGEICSDQNVITPCQYRCEYGCYQNYAKCEEVDSSCQWVEEAGFSFCMEKCAKEDLENKSISRKIRELFSGMFGS